MNRIRRIGRWIRSHPVWSAIGAVMILLIGYSVLAPSAPTYAYITEQVGRGTVQVTVAAGGRLRPRTTIKVGSEVSGQIIRVNVDFNSQVSAGQVLAVIDPTPFQARVEQAAAQVAQSRASLTQADAAMMRARAEVAIQERNDARSRALVAQGFLSAAARDNVVNQLAAARAGVATAAAQIASARAQIRQSDAALANARVELRRTVIRAPASGVIINRLVDPGTTVVASFQTPSLFEIAADISSMQVEATVDEADIGQVREGQQAFFTVDAYPDRQFPARVRQVRSGSTESQNVVSYLTILEVDNREGRLLPGMTANVQIVIGTRQNVLRVSTQALRFRPREADRPDEPATEAAPDAEGSDAPGNATVYVATTDPYRPARRRIRIGLQGEDFAQVLSGLRAGERTLVRSRSLEPRPDGQDDGDEDSGGSGS